MTVLFDNIMKFKVRTPQKTLLALVAPLITTQRNNSYLITVCLSLSKQFNVTNRKISSQGIHSITHNLVKKYQSSKQLPWQKLARKMFSRKIFTSDPNYARHDDQFSILRNLLRLQHSENISLIIKSTNAKADPIFVIYFPPAQT